MHARVECCSSSVISKHVLRYILFIKKLTKRLKMPTLQSKLNLQVSKLVFAVETLKYKLLI